MSKIDTFKDSYRSFLTPKEKDYIIPFLNSVLSGDMNLKEKGFCVGKYFVELLKKDHDSFFGDEFVLSPVFQDDNKKNEKILSVAKIIKDKNHDSQADYFIVSDNMNV